jgi:hypothetical protein
MIDRRNGVALLGAILMTGAATPVLAKTTFSVETDYRLGYDANPFLSAGSDVSATYVETSVAPRLTIQSAKGQTTASGHFDRTGYLRNYGKNDAYGAELETQQRVTTKLTVFGALRYDSEVIGQGRDDVTGDPIDAPDVNLIGLRRRSNTYAASGGWQYQATPKDQISADGGFTATRFANGPGGADSNNYGGRIGWKHAINAKTKVGISGSVYRIEYDTAGLSTLIMQPQVTFSTVLSPTWTVDASLGMSFSRLNLPGIAPSVSTQGLAGSLQLCHTGRRTNLCLVADRSVSASGAGSTVERTQIGVNYRHALNERTTFLWNGSYSRSEGQAGLLGTRQFVSGRGGLEYQLQRGIRIGAEGYYRDIFGQGFPVKADIGGDIYATIQLAQR